MTASINDIEAWVAAGWAIFPCHSIRGGVCSCGDANCDSPGKHPRTWNGVKSATSDSDTVRGWAEQWPDANWAVATGAPSDLVVIDLDVKKGKDGYKSFADFLTKSHLPEPQTFTVRTGSGGRHLFFRTLGEPVRNRTNWLVGVDVRGDGGYVLLPNSNHLSGGTYEVEHVDSLAYLPDKIASSIGRASEGSSTLEGLSFGEFLDGIDEGARDETIFRMTCKLRRVLGDDPVIRRFIEGFVLDAAANSNPPFPEDQARRKIEQAYKQDHRNLHDFDLSMIPFDDSLDPFVDVAGLLSGDLTVPQPDAGSHRTDGVPLLYSGKVNALYGDPEAGKTLIAMCMAADTLARGGSAMFIDVDHNGAQIVLTRMLSLGVGKEVLSDRSRFRLAEPEDADAYLHVMRQALEWAPSFVLIDSIGELGPMFRLNSNSSDDYATLNRVAIQPFAAGETAVVIIDHYPKDRANRSGPGGTIRKSATLNGVGYEVFNSVPFSPSHGGRAVLYIAKDRPGGIRAKCTPGKRAKAATIVMAPGAFETPHSTWFFQAPDEPEPGVVASAGEADDQALIRDKVAADVEALERLSPPPKSKSDVMTRMKWGAGRAMLALQTFRAAHDAD